jgi:hypothetical protein
MDNVQKHNNCIKVPSSQTFRIKYSLNAKIYLIDYYDCGGERERVSACALRACAYVCLAKCKKSTL